MAFRPTGFDLTVLSGGPAAHARCSEGSSRDQDAFAKQLRDSGWTAGAPTSGARTRTQTFAKSVDGVPYITLLAIYALDATHYVALADVSAATQ